MTNRFDIVAVIRAPLENYPPSLNQLAILAENGWRILVIDVPPQDNDRFGEWKHPNVSRKRHGRYEPGSLLQRVADFIFFCRTTRKAIRLTQPRVVLAYDPNAMIAASLSNAFNVWHFHELFEPRSGGGPLTRCAVAYANRNAFKADMVVFPDEGRVEVFQTFVGRPIHCEVIFNCPRRLEVLPSDGLRTILNQHGVEQKARIILFQGWIGPSRCLETIIQSIHLWPDDAHLVLLGPVRDGYRSYLLSLATELEVNERLTFLDRVPYAELMGISIGADIGLSIISEEHEPTLNWKYTAGAINKRFEYMAVGLPQIANRGPGMKALIEDSGVGRLVDPTSPQEIGSAICQLLADNDARKDMAVMARQKHLDTYCYEVQFAPILAKLTQILQGHQPL